MTEKLYTPKEVAKLCNIWIDRVRKAMDSGELEFISFDKPGAKKAKTRRITQGALDRWLATLSSSRETIIL